MKNKGKNMLNVYIAEQLKRKGIAREDFAKSLGRDVSTISNWINGKYDIPLDLLREISEALGEETPIKLYDLAGLLDGVPGENIVRLLNGVPIEHLRVMESLMRAYLESQKNQ